MKFLRIWASALGIIRLCACARRSCLVLLMGESKEWRTWFSLVNMLRKRASSAALHKSAMVSNCAGRKPRLYSLRRSLCSRRFCVSDMYPHHAGEAYVSLATSVARDTSHSESPFKPCALRIWRAYMDWAVWPMILSICTSKDKFWVEVTLKILSSSTRLMPGNGGREGAGRNTLWPQVCTRSFLWIWKHLISDYWFLPIPVFSPAPEGWYGNYMEGLVCAYHQHI